MGAEVIQYLITDPAGVYLDGTCGTGGHATLIVEKLTAAGRLIACDQDPRMLRIAEQRLAHTPGKVRLMNVGYQRIDERLTAEDKPLSGFVIDCGVASPQLAEGAGFAFNSDNPLDMRFDPSAPVRAADLINQAPRAELRRIFRQYGELPQAAVLAERIVDARERAPITTTFQLREVVRGLFPSARLAKHLAQLGQSLRIAVNHELENLAEGLRRLTALLAPGGRLVVISYHSLEDRIVKNFIREHSREAGFPSDISRLFDARAYRLTPLLRRAVAPSPAEMGRNPRARSAKLRAAARV